MFLTMQARVTQDFAEGSKGGDSFGSKARDFQFEKWLY